MVSQTTLFYTHDPMCSWCWGFHPELQKLLSSLPKTIDYKRIVGGLAPDSDSPMSNAMQKSIMSHWQLVQKKIPGTLFNYDFWDNNTPCRSTYPACRAVITATQFDTSFDEAMTQAIQQAYYRDALNPSDEGILVMLATSLGIPKKGFELSLHSSSVEKEFQKQLRQAREIGANSFPSLILKTNNNRYCTIPIDYLNADNMLKTIIVQQQR